MQRPDDGHRRAGDVTEGPAAQGPRRLRHRDRIQTRLTSTSVEYVTTRQALVSTSEYERRFYVGRFRCDGAGCTPALAGTTMSAVGPLANPRPSDQDCASEGVVCFMKNVSAAV